MIIDPECCLKCRELSLKEREDAGEHIPFQDRMQTRMYVCPDCGDKRCPKAANHKVKCHDSK